MTPRKLLFMIILSISVFVLLEGCSIKPVPYDELQYYRDEYNYGGGFYGDPVRYDDSNYRAWQMSQYYRYANEPGYQAYFDANIEGNVNQSGNYSFGETPVKQAPNQSSQVRQITRSNRVKQRKDVNDKKLTRTDVRNSQSEIGEEQRSKAQKLRREKMKEAIDKRKLEKEKDDKLTKEELEKQRQKAALKKKR